VETTIEKLKRHKSPGIDQIPVELIKVGFRTIWYEVHKLKLFCLELGGIALGVEESIIVPTYKKGDNTDCGTVFPSP